ncbi:MAG: phospho-N-acetylmuramoyl-pentapeptide-transferase [Puniceicoccales bacterium]|jgi:phospho-N-acetylmuramoyl-pentapeptide-transferase|nr:phospho-N-acetylmuramoyl-pentapeptide-transferase [Puniceicoccales bacterium]
MLAFNNIFREIHWLLDLLRRIGYAFGSSFAVAAISAPFVIKYLKNRKMEQVLRSQNEVRNLAQLHSAKARTPTMGGIIIAIATLCGTIPFVRWNSQVTLAIFCYLALAAVGLIDDLAKIRTQNTRGVPGRIKLLIQFTVAATVAAVLHHYPDFYKTYTTLPIPFFGRALLLPSFGCFVIFLFFVLSGTSNAVNLTDGLDGLVTQCAIPILLFFGVLAVLTGNIVTAAYCAFPHIPGNGELAILCAATLGALLVFLWHNGYPAVIFMGDMGSLSLGMLIGVVALLTNHPLHLVFVGGIFVLETLSDVIQVASFRYFGGRRVFRMAPIHHHFELAGVHEVKITRCFGMITWALVLLGIFSLIIKI